MAAINNPMFQAFLWTFFGLIFMLYISPDLLLLLLKAEFWCLKVTFKIIKAAVYWVIRKINLSRQEKAAENEKAGKEAEELAKKKEAVQAFIDALNERGKHCNYPFFHMGEIVDFGFDADSCQTILSMEDGSVLKGTVKFGKDLKVEEWASEDGKYILYGDTSKLLSYKVIRNDVKDIVNNDLYSYVNTEIAETLPGGKDRVILFDAAEGLGIPEQEFQEKYDTPSYNKAWDEVLADVFGSCAIQIRKAGIGKYYLSIPEKGGEE